MKIENVDEHFKGKTLPHILPRIFDGKYELHPFFPGDNYGGNLTPGEIQSYMLPDENWYPYVHTREELEKIISSMDKNIELGIGSRFHDDEFGQWNQYLWFDMVGVDYGDFRCIKSFVKFILRDYMFGRNKHYDDMQIQVLFSGQSYHVVIDQYVSDGEWREIMYKSLYAPFQRVQVDSRFIGRALTKGFSVLRLTANCEKHYNCVPYQVKTFTYKEIRDHVQTHEDDILPF